MTSEPDDKILAGEYAMGLVEGPRKLEADQRHVADARFAAEVETWRTRFAAFDDSAESQPIDDALWSKIEADVTAAVLPPSKPSPWTLFWNSIGALRTTALAATFATLLLAVGLGIAIRAASRQPVMMAVLLDGNRAGAVVQTFADGRVVLVPIASISVPPGRALQVWTLPSRERGPVSVGLMHQARTLQLSLKDLPEPQPDQLFEITLEPAAGSPTGRPTGPILFKGNTASTL